MEPITRSEQYLASILGEDVVLPIPQSRIEYYLNAIAQNGIAPSSAGLINYDPDANYPDGSIGKEMHTLDGDVSQLKSDFDNIVALDSTAWEIGTINSSGGETSSTTRIRSPYIAANSGTTIAVSGNADCLYAYFFDESKTLQAQSSNWCSKDTAPAGTAYIRILIRKSSSNGTITSGDVAGQVERCSIALKLPQNVFLYTQTAEDLDETELNAAQAIEAVFNGDVDAKPATWVYKRYVTDSGNFSTSNGMWGTDYIEIPAGAKKLSLSYVKTTKAAELRIAQYNATKQYIAGSYQKWLSSTSVSVPFDSNAKYFAVSVGNWSTNYDQSEVVSAVAFAFVTLVSEISAPSIMSRCADQIDAVFTGADNRTRTGGTTPSKNFAMLMISDTHGDTMRLSNCVELLNGCDAIDGAIHLGDIINTAYNSSDLAKEVAVINKAEKPLLTVMGNHDGRQSETTNCTVETAAAAFMGATNEASAYEDRGYGYYDFETYKIRVIVLNDYDFPDNKSGDNWVYYGSQKMYLQAQIDWFITTLSDTPADYSVIIASHFCEPTTLDQSIINQHVGTSGVDDLSATRGGNGKMDDTIISDIVDAWIDKTTLTKSYTYTTQDGDITGVSVSADFSSRSASLFVCRICGHVHCEGIGHVTDYSDQLVYVHDTSALTANDTTSWWTTAWSLIPRSPNGKSQDLLTVLCVDTANKRVNFVRVGANLNMFGEDSGFISVSYAGS